MSLYHVFQAQTGVFAQEANTGWFNYFVNASGQLMCQPPTGSPFSAASSFATTGAREALATVSGIFRNVTSTATGLFYGNTGTAVYPTLLGAPDYWISALGPQGQLLSVPAYVRSS